MPTQTKTLQRRVLEQAQRDGYADLYWYIEATAPGLRIFPAAYPGRWIPVVPVAPDPAVSRRYADMLGEFFRLSNSPAVTFVAALTHLESLERTGCAWYLWDRDVEIDAVCADCGCVEQVGHTVIEGATWLCVECAERSRWSG